MENDILTSNLIDCCATAQVESYELIDDQTVGRFRLALEQLVGRGAKSVKLDMTKVLMLSSVAICALIAVDRELKQRGGQLELQKVGPNCLDIFAHMRLHELLVISPSPGGLQKKHGRTTRRSLAG
jgi:anti-anti-sigma regulatory factor